MSVTNIDNEGKKSDNSVRESMPWLSGLVDILVVVTSSLHQGAILFPMHLYFLFY